MENRNAVIILVVIGLLLALCCVVIVVGVSVSLLIPRGLERASAEAVCDTFLQALKDGDYRKAYDLMHPDLQEEAGFAEDWYIEPDERPQEWTYTEVSQEGDYAYVAGTLVDGNGNEVEFEIYLSREDGRWFIYDLY